MAENVVAILKTADILGIYFLCPITAILIELAVRKKMRVDVNKMDVVIK